MQFATFAGQTVILRHADTGLYVYALEGNPDQDHLDFLEVSSPEKRDDESWQEWLWRYDNWSRKYNEAHHDLMRQSVVVAGWYMWNVTPDQFIEQIRWSMEDDSLLSVERTPKYSICPYSRFTNYMHGGAWFRGPKGAPVEYHCGDATVKFSAWSNVKIVVEWGRR